MLGGAWSEVAEATLREWETAMKWRWKVTLVRALPRVVLGRGKDVRREDLFSALVFVEALAPTV